VTDAVEQPGDDAQPAAAAAGMNDAFTPADLVAAGDALGPEGAIESGLGATSNAADTGALEALAATAAAAAPPAPAAAAPTDGGIVAAIDPGDASLLGLIERLGGILERSDLTELEVEAGRTTVILRKPVADAPPVAPNQVIPTTDLPLAPTQPPPGVAGRGAAPAAGQSGPPARPSVKAPLTGIWYASPTPGSAPFVEVGRELAVGQVVGLIEAMKLFNEIKSDIAGRVVRVVPDSGTLVKAKQPLIEVEPL
jgi:acetyl-CoA carboxylase biotin carboxyl carrier protein